MTVPGHRRSPSGLSVVGAFRHHGSARALVHRLKYHADLGAGRILARAMANRVDAEWSCLVPVPRAILRRFRYGIDPARWLAREVGRLSGLPVVDALAPGVWWPPHAGAKARRPPSLRLTVLPGAMAVLVDDVATTGATLDEAAVLTGAHLALVANVALGPFGPSHG